ncbi:hypothetical protein DXG03_004760 [Asterophora parasitica]|uniref:UBX domain-containing protein n=1 Tax=Asterophora parasitica TaxID=117018 RepID=A0A9P7G9H0_9AGAR|nr:hypothetical protein DXG03_004760 [Asterophora parasitica]
MSHLDARQQQALIAQLKAVIGATDDDVAASVLESVGWDVQRAADLVFNSDPTITTSTTRHMEPLNIDDSEVAPPRPTPSSFSIFAFPFHILSNLVRFIFSVLRIPIPQFRAPDRWVRELEEETGAVSIGTTRADTAATTATDSAGPSSLTARRTYDDPATKILPEFTLGSYEDALHICQRDARIGCVVLVSEEHDDVAEFKRTTLTDPTFVNLLHENNVVVWGGDVRDREAWSAAEKLQATTYPFVAFLALQPRRASASTTTISTSSSNNQPILTILSRHQTPVNTSPTALCAHLTNQLLPRVTPFLNRIQAVQRERERDRSIREAQDAAFRDTARRDKERILEKIAEEERKAREARERGAAQDLQRKREQEQQLAWEKAREVREGWRRWGRRVQAQQGTSRGQIGTEKSIRLALRLPSGGRILHSFLPTETLTTLYAFVDAQLVPPGIKASEDPDVSPEGHRIPSSSSAAKLEETLEGVIAAYGKDQRDVEGKESDWWSFTILLSYPRVSIPWRAGVSLGEVEALREGGQVVVEMLGSPGSPLRANGNGSGSGGQGEEVDDGYATESDEE